MSQLGCLAQDTFPLGQGRGGGRGHQRPILAGAGSLPRAKGHWTDPEGSHSRKTMEMALQNPLSIWRGDPGVLTAWYLERQARCRPALACFPRGAGMWAGRGERSETQIGKPVDVRLEPVLTPELTLFPDRDTRTEEEGTVREREGEAGEVSGRTLIDIGSGPTIYQLLSACAHFEDITMTDFLEANRQELGLWLREEPGAFDWSVYSQHVCLIEGKGESWQEKERQLRARVKRVLPIDVHQSQPLGAGSLAPLPADALVSAFCLEAVSPDLASFQRALDHITTLLRPGGHLLLIGALEESWYLAGEARLAVVPVCEEEVREALEHSGYEVRDLRTYTMPARLQTGVDDVKGIFFTWAQKKVGV
uniref:Phenylethanolamine N-methyltransferase n=1 Tax=Equus caballus TaxID=9796 RepID=A0A9L0TMX4_HORSE